MELEAGQLRDLLEALVDHVRAEVLAGRDRAVGHAVDHAVAADGPLADVTGRTAADTTYRIDAFGDDALVEWFRERWPVDVPVEVVAEGLHGEGSTVLPLGTAPDAAVVTCIVDPVDGTRMLMHDKRSAWVLAAAAPRTPAGRPRLRGLVAAAMAELPPTKQRRADRYSAVRGVGLEGLRSQRRDLDTGSATALAVRPSRATDLRHGFASFARFFPEGKALLAGFEERLWRELYGERSPEEPWLPVFEDQYLASGGQIHELLVGHDRVAGDLRPLAHAELGLGGAMAAHPYDVCTALVLEEAGGVVTDPWGRPLDAPLDITTPVAWVGYANRELATRVGAAVTRVVTEVFPSASIARDAAPRRGRR